MEHTPCNVYIPIDSVHSTRFPVGAETPLKLEVMTDEGECFAIGMTRAAWAKLLLGATEVPGWIEPLVGDEDDDNPAVA